MKFLAVLAVLVAAFVSSKAICPRMVTRAQWGARAASTVKLPTRPAPFYVVHHTGGLACSTGAACAQQMRNIQNFHMHTNGWADIGYNFCIGGDGIVYYGRGWDRQGAHTPSFNGRSIGVCFLGTFKTTLPSLAARNAAQQLFDCGVTLGHVRSNYWLIGHRQAVVTECPGTALFNEIRTWPRFNSNPL